MAKKEKDIFTKSWIIENSVDIISRYERGILTIRGLHYQLVSLGMTNDTAHYKRVGSAMTDARWNGDVHFEAFSDHERAMLGITCSSETDLEDKIECGQEQVEAWMLNFSKNRWENQPYYPEIFIEKKALQGVFQRVCQQNYIGLGACKGYPSLTFLNDAAKRFKVAEDEGKIPIILYFGDYDPSGEDIPRSIEEKLRLFGCNSIQVRRIALMEHQVIEWKLPHAPVKVGDSRTANWDGIGQVELDAVKPEKLQKMCQDAIDDIFDTDLHDELMESESDDREIYRSRLKEFVSNL